MQISNYDTPEKLTALFAWLAHPATPWEKEGVSLSKLDQLIKNHMRLIVGQTENAKTAPKLQQSLFDLSKRMEKEHTFDSPEGHHLAFEVTTVAMGIFTKPEDPQKPEWTELPPEVLRIIFSKNPPLNSRRSELDESSDVSKEWKVNAEIVSKDWIDQEVIPLRNYGCKTAEEAVQFIIDKNLLSANLNDFSVTDKQLTKLIENCPRIVHLILEGLNSEFPLEKLTNLKELILLNCYNISKAVFSKGLKKLRQLTFLNLKGCSQFTEIESLGNLSKLTYLNLSFCRHFSGNMLFGTLKRLTELTFLDLSFCDQKIPEDDLVEAFTKLSKLTHLNLSQCKGLPGNVVDGLKNLLQLTYLNLSYCYQIPGERLIENVKNLLQLTYLNLSYCYQIPGERLVEALKNLSQLKELYLSGCKQIPGEGLVEALKNLSQLTHLNLSGCDQIPGKTLAEILKNFPKLVHLDLSVCSFEGDELAEALQNLSQLTYLDLSHGDKITEVQLDQVLKNLPQLKTLNLMFCSQITKESIDKWRKQYPNIRFFH